MKGLIGVGRKPTCSSGTSPCVNPYLKLTIHHLNSLTTILTQTLIVGGTVVAGVLIVVINVKSRIVDSTIDVTGVDLGGTMQQIFLKRIIITKMNHFQIQHTGSQALLLLSSMELNLIIIKRVTESSIMSNFLFDRHADYGRSQNLVF